MFLVDVIWLHCDSEMPCEDAGPYQCNLSQQYVSLGLYDVKDKFATLVIHFA